MPRGVPRIPEAREWVLKRQCTRCGETKPWARFPPHTYWPDGSVRRVASHCSACDSKLTSARERKYREERSEQWKRREQRRLVWQRRKRREIAAERAPQYGRRLPIGPIRGFLHVQMEAGMTIKEIVEICELPEKGILRLLYDHKQVTLRMADTIATKLGAHLYDLYPELLEMTA